MRFDAPLDDVFLNRSHVRVLRALYLLPEGLPASGREIARRGGITHPTALKSLALLVDTGLVYACRGPGGDAYVLNGDHLLAGQVAGLFDAEADVRRELATFLRNRMLALTDKVDWATLFGSVVWGGSSATSDIDVALSCSRAHVEEVENAMSELSDEVRRRFGNHLSPLINARKQRPSAGIWRRLEDQGVPLIRSGRAVEA